ncbi:MAG: extracellular solute-binding protein [Gaiellaceae bacterium]
MTQRVWRLAVALVVAFATVTVVAAAASKPVIELWTIQRTENNAETNAAKSYTAAKVNVTITANDPYKQKLKAAMATNKLPDIFMNWGGGGLDQYVKAGKVLDLTPYLKLYPAWKNKFFANVLETAKFRGKYYGIPNVGMQPVVLFYNKKVLADHGLKPPTKWADLLSDVAKLKSAGVTPIILGGQSKWPDLMWEEYLVDRVAGPGAFNSIAAGNKTWNNPNIIKANTMLQQLAKAGAFGSFESTTYDGTVTATLLGKGKGAMELMGNWEYGAILSNVPAMIKSHNLGWEAFPGIPGGLGNSKDIAGNTSNFYSVTHKSKHPWPVVQYLKKQVMNNAYINTLIADGNIPPIKGILTKLKAGANAGFTTWCYNLVQQAPHYQHSWDQVLFPDPANALLTNLDQLLLGNITPQKFSQNMNAAM